MNKTLLSRQATGLTFGMVMALVTILTLGKNKVSLAGLWSTEVHNHRSLDLQLFNGWVEPTVWYGPFTNTFGNILLFLPIGFLLMHVGRHRSILATTAIGAAISLFIEVTQYVLAIGYTDIDDLLFNTLGAFLGAVLATRLGTRSRSWAVAVVFLGTVVTLSVIALTN